MHAAMQMMVHIRHMAAVKGIIPARQSANIKKPLIKMPSTFENTQPLSENVEKSLEVTGKKPAPITRMQSHHKRKDLLSDSRSGIEKQSRKILTARKTIVFLFNLKEFKKFKPRYLYTVRCPLIP